MSPPLPTPEEERAVVERLRAGDPAAVGPLFEWYGDRLYRQVILPRLPNPELAEDVLKDTFRLALENGPRYRPQGPSIFPWLRRIAINRAVDVHRAHARQRRLESVRDESFTAPPPPPPDRGPELEELKLQVERALDSISPRYATALRLRLLQGLSREDCARRLGVRVGTFDVLFHRACKAFRKAYPP